MILAFVTLALAIVTAVLWRLAHQRSAERRVLERLAHGDPDSLLILDRNGDLRYSNPAARRLLDLDGPSEKQAEGHAGKHPAERVDAYRLLSERLKSTDNLDLTRDLVPRYGENAHQEAAVYRIVGDRGVLAGLEQLQGKELSWNNLLDTDAARRLVAGFEEPAVVIVKHNNPCGVGVGEDMVTAYERALACDPTSAFGSVIALNRAADSVFAEAAAKLFVEVVTAPEIDEEARNRVR